MCLQQMFSYADMMLTATTKRIGVKTTRFVEPQGGGVAGDDVVKAASTSEMSQKRVGDSQ